MRKTFITLFALIFIVPMIEKCTGPAFAQDDDVLVEEIPEYKIRLEWERNPEPYISKYEIYFRPSKGAYDFNEPIWAGNDTSAEVIISQNGFFTVRAVAFYDGKFYKSNPSIEAFEGRIDPPATPSVPDITALERIDNAIEEISIGVKSILGNMGIEIDCNDENIDPGIRASATYRIQCSKEHTKK